MVMEDHEMDAEQLGVATALERTCTLQARLRQAIQETHAVSRDFEHDAGAADREHDALLAANDQLELLEEKLRGYSTIDSDRYEDKTVALSQLDSLRRELITITHDSFSDVTFAKDIVREVQAFAEMRGDADYTSDSGSESEMTYDLDGTGSEVSSATEGASPVRLYGNWQYTNTLEGSDNGDTSEERKEQQPWAEQSGIAAAPPPRPAAVAQQFAPHRAYRRSSADTPAYAADSTRQAVPQYQSAADRILTGRQPAGKSAYAPVADRILLGDMPGSPEPEPRPATKMRHLRLGGDPSAVQAQRTSSVQAPVTPSSPAAHTPPRSANAGQAGASPGGWASRARDMWRGAPAQQPAHPRHDVATSSSDSGGAVDDLRFGGKLDVAGMAAKPMHTPRMRAPPSMPQVQDTSAGGDSRRPRDAAPPTTAQRGGERSDEAGARPRRWRGALAAVASAVIGATAVVVIQGQDTNGGRSHKLTANDTPLECIGIEAGTIKSDKLAGQYLMSLPDVNLGRG